MADIYTHVVSFEIKWEDDAKAYNTVRDALHAAVIKDLANSDYWCETTSFYVVRTSEKSADMFARVWRDGKMRTAKDILVVMNVSSKAGKAGGAIKDQTLFSLVPALK